MAIDTTISGPNAVSYLSVSDATARMASYPNSATWTAKSTPEKEALLQQGTRLIDRAKDWSPRLVQTQRLCFPRTCDAAGTLPERLLTALAEFLDFSCDASLVPLKRLQAEGVTSASILGQSMSFDGSGSAPQDRSGLPAGARAELDLLYELQPTEFTAERVDDPSAIFG